MRRLGVVIALLPALADITAQTQERWVTPRTAWGDPDLTGLWPTTVMVGVPLERDPALGTRNVLTDAEFAVRQRLAHEQRDADDADFSLENARPAAGPELPLRVSGQVVDNPVAPPPHWLELGTPSRQASLIVDPPNGRLPMLTEEGRQRAEAVAARRGNPRSVADRTLYPRCISRGVVGSVLPMVTDSGNEIMQAPGYVVIRHEMIHETRIIPLDGRPHLAPAIGQYMGDSRGRWDGETLIVETTNLRGDLAVAVNGSGTPTLSPKTILKERFTRVAENVLDYQITVHDPVTWVVPFTIRFPWYRDQNHTLFEFSCHEGNYAMRNILAAERVATSK
jgi:hypothetical protein